MTRDRTGDRTKNIAGKRYGRLIAEELVGVNKEHGIALWRCRCDCGKVRVIAGTSLRATPPRGTKSCGCARIEKLRDTHAARRAARAEVSA